MINNIISKTLRSLIGLFIGASVLTGCLKSGYDEMVVYDNEFKTGSTEKLTGAKLYKYEGEYVIGRYNQGGFTLDLENLPNHKALQVIVEPRFHDSWDGNNNFGGIDGPDLWNLKVDGIDLVYSTFSNSPCNSLYCLFQSYPASYGVVNNPPRTEATSSLPRVCHSSDAYGTSGYKMVKTIKHTGSSAKIQFQDYLVQLNAADKICDESWSVYSLKVKVLNTP